MRSPTLASAAVTPAPTATTTPHGSCPAMTGSALAGMPVPARGRFFGRRYCCRSEPHMPEAFISSTTSPGPGVGSGKVMISTARSPENTTPRMASSVCCLLRRNLSRFVASPYPEIGNKLRQRHLAKRLQSGHNSEVIPPPSYGGGAPEGGGGGRPHRRSPEISDLKFAGTSTGAFPPPALRATSPV